MILVVLPAHLRTLAQVNGDVQLEIQGRATQRAVLDALEVALSDAAWHDSRPSHARAPAIFAVLRVRRGFVICFAGRAASGRSRLGQRAIFHHRSHCRRLIS